MKLSEIVGAAHGLAVYAEVALVLFLVAFITVLVQIATGHRAREWERARGLPLLEDEPAAIGAECSGGGKICASEGPGT